MAKTSIERGVIIPDYDPYKPKPYPEAIKPGYYSKAEVKKLLRKHKRNSEAIQFIRDMLED